MVDRVDLSTAVAYCVATAILVALGLSFGPQGPTGLAWILGIAPFVFLFGLPGFWALNMRRGLAVRLYRNQALGIALVSALFVVAVADPTGISYSYALVAIFYWMDASILAARRTDPLLRNTLIWSRLRWVLWGILFVGIILPSFYQLLTGFDFTTLLNGPEGIIFLLPYLVDPFTGVVLFALVSRRSSDSALKRQLVWFGLFAFMQFATVFLVGSLIGSFGGLSYVVGFAVASFFLYKSARALVPLNRISALDTVDNAVPSMGAVELDRQRLPT